jgi:oxaloacetate decarboxylase beta subunit
MKILLFANLLHSVWEDTGFSNMNWDTIFMILAGLVLIVLSIRFNLKPILLIPLALGIVIGNIPFMHNAPYPLGIYTEGSILNYLFFGIQKGIYPALIFLGLGAMVDLSPMIANPKLIILGAAAQVGILITFLGAVILGFPVAEAASIGIIGGADGNTAIFLTSTLGAGLKNMPDQGNVQGLIGPVAIAAYLYMALVPVIQPPIMKLLTTKKERLLRMKPLRSVSRREKIAFPLAFLLLTAFVAPASLPLLGMFFFGNILRESGLTKQLAGTISTVLIDVLVILVGITVGASTQADVFLKWESVLIFVLGAISFTVATAGGVIFAKVMNLFLKKENRINPLIGAAGVAAIPDSAKIAHDMGQAEDSTNHLITHAMAPNIAGIIGTAVTAGLLLAFIL